MQTNYLFQSNRLGFRNWKIGDHEPFADLNNDPEVMAFLPKGLCVEESSEMISRMENTHNDLGFTFFAVDLLETNEFIGFIGIIRSSFDAFFTPCYEISWRFKRSVWNKGLASEGAIACLKYGFEVLQMDNIHSITSVLNKKIGIHNAKNWYDKAWRI